MNTSIHSYILLHMYNDPKCISIQKLCTKKNLAITKIESIYFLALHSNSFTGILFYYQDLPMYVSGLPKELYSFSLVRTYHYFRP